LDHQSIEAVGIVIPTKANQSCDTELCTGTHPSGKDFTSQPRIVTWPRSQREV